MERAVTWSPEAIEDVEAITEWISKDSPQHAGAVVERFVEQAQSLTDHPKRGRVVPELADPHYRELLVYSYRLVYRLDNTAVTIIAVIHGRQLLANVDNLPLS